MSAVAARSLCKLAVIQEAIGAGATLTNMTDVVIGRNTALSGAMTALFGGSFSIDAFSCFHFQTAGIPYLFVQPFAGVYSMPGEHHVWLQGTLRAPTNWESGIFNDRWKSVDPPSAFALEQNRMLTGNLKGIRWEWKIGRGEIEYAWFLQTRPFRGGLTHLAMKATGEKIGLSLMHRTGAVRLVQIAAQLQPSLAHVPGYGEMPFMVESKYGDLFSLFLDGKLTPTVLQAKTAPSDFSQQIMQALAQAPASKLLLYPLAPNKDACVRNFILPPAARHLPIVAAIDTTMMGSMKEGFVFTPTHGFYKVDDSLISFAWTDVAGVLPVPSLTDDWIVVNVFPFGELAIPTAGRAGPMAQLFHWFSTIP